MSAAASRCHPSSPGARQREDENNGRDPDSARAGQAVSSESVRAPCASSCLRGGPALPTFHSSWSQRVGFRGHPEKGLGHAKITRTSARTRTRSWPGDRHPDRGGEEDQARADSTSMAMSIWVSWPARVEASGRLHRAAVDLPALDPARRASAVERARAAASAARLDRARARSLVLDESTATRRR
jgi:hypothetical protein